ncbi:RnfABCDGE type electron transport complex subunit G [Desulfocurvus sp. DL9XJH121]
MREIIHMIVALTLICGVSGFGLATLKSATRDRIEGQVLTYVQGPALLGMIGEHDNDPIAQRVKVDNAGSPLTVFPVQKGGKLTGVAMETFAPGYSGDIGVMVGFDLESDELLGIGITTQTETPGLGTRVTEPGFTAQFVGHAPANLDLGGDINGVSGATFSSTGTVNAVKKAVDTYKTLKPAILEALKGERSAS